MRSFPYPIPEEKKVQVILDTDCACEADDPYAIVHALLSPKISVTGICAEHLPTVSALTVWRKVIVRSSTFWILPD